MHQHRYPLYKRDFRWLRRLVGEDKSMTRFIRMSKTPFNPSVQPKLVRRLMELSSIARIPKEETVKPLAMESVLRDSHTRQMQGPRLWTTSAKLIHSIDFQIHSSCQTCRAVRGSAGGPLLHHTCAAGGSGQLPCQQCFVWTRTTDPPNSSPTCACLEEQLFNLL